MNQIYDFESILRMNKIDLENLSFQHNMKIKRCSAHLNMLISNITDEQESELFLNLITNQIYCIKYLYNQGLLQFKGKYFKYLPECTNLMIKYILILPNIEEFQNRIDNVSEDFYHIYFIYRDIITYENYDFIYGYIHINLQKECKDLNNIANIKNIISVDNIYVNPKYIEEYIDIKRIININNDIIDIDINVGIICKANSIKDIFEVIYNLLNDSLKKIAIKYVSYNYHLKTIILEYI